MSEGIKTLRVVEGTTVYSDSPTSHSDPILDILQPEPAQSHPTVDITQPDPTPKTLPPGPSTTAQVEDVSPETPIFTQSVMNWLEKSWAESHDTCW
jgi:hypothetical protein